MDGRVAVWRVERGDVVAAADDANTFAHHVVRLLRDLASSRFTWEATAQRFSEVFHKVLY
jgi:hypothetical protein